MECVKSLRVSERLSESFIHPRTSLIRWFWNSFIILVQKQGVFVRVCLYVCGYNTMWSFYFHTHTHTHTHTHVCVYIYIYKQSSQSIVICPQCHTNICLITVLSTYQSPCNSGNGTYHISLTNVELPAVGNSNSQLRLKIYLTFSRLMTYIYIYTHTHTHTHTHTYIYICRTASLTSRCCILYIYSINIRTEYFKRAAHSPFFPLQNAVYFIMLPFLVPVLFTF